MLGERMLPPPRTFTQALAKNQKFLVGGFLIVLAIGYLITTSLQSSAVYYLTIPEMRSKSMPPTEVFRVNGKVLSGSIANMPNGVRFVMHDPSDASQVVSVAYRGIVPDTFKDQADVVVEGKLSASGEFEATTLLAKCPSKFEAST